MMKKKTFVLNKIGLTAFEGVWRSVRYPIWYLDAPGNLQRIQVWFIR